MAASRKRQQPVRQQQHAPLDVGPTVTIAIRLPISVILDVRRVSKRKPGQTMNEYVQRAVLWQLALDDAGMLPAETEGSEPEPA